MNKQEAADFLGVSTRAIERYTTKEQLHPTYKNGKYGAEAVYDQAELETLKAERDQPTDKPTSAAVATVRGVKAEEMGMMARAFAEALFKQGGPLQLSGAVVSDGVGAELPPSEIDKLLFLTLRQAASLSGLSAGVLREAIRAGKLKARRDLGRGFKIKRVDLDAYVKKL